MYEILMTVWKCGDVVVTVVVPRPWKEICLHFRQFSSIYFTIPFTSILVLIIFASEKHLGGFHGSIGVQQE
jgi:hypothetical protein